MHDTSQETDQPNWPPPNSYFKIRGYYRLNYDQQLDDVAREIYQQLSKMKPTARIVLAESCSGGRAATALVGVPGISEYFCGSAVVYRPDSKMRWLGIPEELIEQYTAESPEVTQALAIAILERTLEATIAAAITGHLSKDLGRVRSAPHIFVAVAFRNGDNIESAIVRSEDLCGENRGDRQSESALSLLTSLLSFLMNPAFANRT